MKHIYFIGGTALLLQGLSSNNEYYITVGSIFVATYHILNKLDKRGD